MSGFEDVVLEKLDAIERRMGSVEKQMTALVNAFRQHGSRLAALEATCLENHAGTPIPKPVRGGR